jgi:hypothetical protein
VEAPTVGLTKTNLYPAEENRFFMKSMPVNIEFVPDGKIIVDDEGEKYVLSKVNDTLSTKPSEENPK